MLLRAVCSFDSKPEDRNRTISFSRNDNLIFLEVHKKDSNWFLVVDILGRVGYIPKNLVEPDELYAECRTILAFFDFAITKRRRRRPNGSRNATKLEFLRNEFAENPSIMKKRAGMMIKMFHTAPVSENDRVNRSASQQNFDSCKYFSKADENPSISAERPPVNLISSESELELNNPTFQLHCGTENDGTQSKSANPSDAMKQGIQNSKQFENRVSSEIQSDTIIPTSSQYLKAIKSSLIDVIQQTSGLDFLTSEKVLSEVFESIKNRGESCPAIAGTLLERLSLYSISTDNKAINDLEKAMTNMANLSKAGIKSGKGSSGTCISSSEQSQFIEKLDKLRKLLTESNAAHVAQLLQLSQHSFPQDFAHLYHLENPECVKERILDILLIICKLDKKGRAILLSTTLPIYLVRDLLAQIGNTWIQNENKLSIQLMDLLVILFSCGGTMPDTFFEVIGKGFVNFLLKEIAIVFASLSEANIDKCFTEVYCFSLLINLLLAYNLQFSMPVKENIILKVLSGETRRPKGLFTALLELFKKGDDPLQSNKDDAALVNSSISKPIPHSVFKLVSDLCCCQQTAALFTEPETNHLIKIIVDGLFTNSAGSRRLNYIQVLKSRLIHLSPNFNLKDVRAALLRILLDSDPLAIVEHRKIREMNREFPVLFASSISRV